MKWYIHITFGWSCYWYACHLVGFLHTVWPRRLVQCFRGPYYLHLQDFYLEGADGTLLDKCHNLEDHNMHKHNRLNIIYAYKLTSLSKCINFLLIEVSVYDVHGSVILCCNVIRITGWFNVPQFNLYSQTQWHSCDGSYLVSPGLVKQMLGQYLKPLSSTYFYESTKASVPNLLQCWCMAYLGFILTCNSPP